MACAFPPSILSLWNSLATVTGGTVDRAIALEVPHPCKLLVDHPVHSGHFPCCALRPFVVTGKVGFDVTVCDCLGWAQRSACMKAILSKGASDVTLGQRRIGVLPRTQRAFGHPSWTSASTALAFSNSSLFQRFVQTAPNIIVAVLFQSALSRPKEGVDLGN